MKHLIICLVITVFAAQVITAQFTKIGGGMAFSSGFKFHNMDDEANQSGHFTALVKSIYEISQSLQISPSCTIFYPNITEDAYTKTVVSSMMFDINGHYVFSLSDRFEFYGLAGLDILFAWKKDKYESSDTFKESDNALGLNAGAGTCLKITEQAALFAEAKYIISKYGQLMLNAGILIDIGSLKGSEKQGK
jgi:opacity protein-like surface antigen